MIEINLYVSPTNNAEFLHDEIKPLRRFVIGSLWMPDMETITANCEGRFNRVNFTLIDPEFTISDIFRKFRRMKRKFRRKFPNYCLETDLHEQQLVNY